MKMLFDNQVCLRKQGICYCLLFISLASLLKKSWTYGISKGANQIPLVSLDSPTSADSNSLFLNSRSTHDFTLRHLFHHGTYLHPGLHKRFDVRSSDDLWIAAEGQIETLNQKTFHAHSKKLNIQRLLNRSTESIEYLIKYAQVFGFAATLEPSAWTTDEVSGPDITDKETVLSLAQMTSNAYIEEPKTGEWEDVNGKFNVSKSFGWKEDGLRGHIYADRANQTIIITFKGTTPALFAGSGTTLNDKVNDNLLCGCCCGQQGHFLYEEVCSCATSTFKCNVTCVAQEIRMENRYYQAALEIYGNISVIYPDSEVWLTGHSLGGLVSSLLGLTFGLPTVTFAAPGDALAANRLGFPSPPNLYHSTPQTRMNTGIYHFGHTADPIFMGSCNSITSACTIGGYAFESQCHTGQVCVYDTVEDMGWRVSILNHRILGMIQNVFRVYDKVPVCNPEYECVDCYNWMFFQSNGSIPTTSDKGTSTYSSTTTCHTPGMFALFFHFLVSS